MDASREDAPEAGRARPASRRVAAGRRRTLVALALLAVLAAGCASGVGARRIPVREADRRLVASVLATGEPSAWSLQTLHRNALLDVYRRDRGEALRQLHDRLAEPGLDPASLENRLFALSELGFDHARRESERRFGRGEDPRPWFLASAVYALAFLELALDGPRAGRVLDTRTRLAADLYNRALTEGLKRDGEVRLADAEHPLPFGRLALDLDEESLRWGSFRMTDFVPTAELEVRGIANRYRHAGVGASLAPGVVPDPDRSGPDRHRIGGRARVAATLLMRIEPLTLEGLLGGDLRGRLELHPADVSREIRVGERRIPLEVDSTAALALRIDSLRESLDTTRAFLTGDIRAFGAEDYSDQLAMLGPYRPGRIPVVFVHGTHSDPSTWTLMLNELQNDPVLSERLQYWFFFYASGNPVGYSGGLLARALRRIVGELDPEARDPALRKMVVVGHSQGGLLVKLSVVESGLAFWSLGFKKPPGELDVSEETREILRRSLIFEPVDGVARVVFISTPHGGSFLTQNPLTGLLRRLISLPGTLAVRLSDLARRDPEALALGRLDGHPTSLDNMRAGNPFLETLRALPVVEGVGVHSIVAVQGEGPEQELSDGVVEYRSAHIGQGTERVVESGHSAQRHPVAIAEVRRVLRKHLAALDTQTTVGESGPTVYPLPTCRSDDPARSQRTRCSSAPWSSSGSGATTPRASPS